MAFAIPVTLALTLTVFYLYGYTLNRITLFALIFSIGILVDDAIVVVENMVRHFRLPENTGRPRMDVAIEAVDEVGNPTILATFTVIAAIFPWPLWAGSWAPICGPFRSGHLRPWFFRFWWRLSSRPGRLSGLSAKHDGPGHAETEDWSTRLYRKVMTPLIERAFWRWIFLAAVAAMLLAACALVASAGQGQDASL